MFNVRLLSIGNRPAKAIETISQDYLARIPKQFGVFESIDIKLAQRGPSIPYQKAMTDETNRLLDKVKPDDYLIILDRQGTKIDSEKLAKKFGQWKEDNISVAIAIGGPEGFSQETIKTQAKEVWSISSFTMAHPIVKCVMAEQFYRAYAILQNHPYHRGENYQS